MKNKILYLVIGICCIGFTACTHDSDEPEPVVKNELSRSTITVERTVSLTTPGTLQEELEKVIDDVTTLQKLILVGPYNGKDVEYWRYSLTHLVEFDLKDAIPTSNKDEYGYDIFYFDPHGGSQCQNDNEIAPHSFSNMEKLEDIVFPDWVELIGYDACKNCSNLMSIQFGSQLKGIDYHAFQYCNLLDNVVLPDSFEFINENVFADSGITSIEIPSSVTSIKWNVFRNCTNLKSVKLLSTITTIPSSMFDDCPKLESVTLSSSIVEVGESAFRGCTSLKSFPFSQITKIDWGAFQSSGIEEADLSSVTDFSYANSSFSYCNSLKKVILPNNVTSLANGMFYNCKSLIDVNIPSSLEIINDELFDGCGFTEFTFPANIKTICRGAFYGCESLTRVTLNEGLESIGYCAFRGVPITEIIIPSSVKSIGSEAFDGCESLTRVSLNEGLESIGYCAFRGVPITEISIPSTVTELAYGAFESTQIKEITIPETVTTVGGTLFNYCHSLAAIFWNSSADVPHSYDINPNCYVYLGNETIVSDSNWKNIITNIDGEYVAESITLCEGGQRDNANMSYSVPMKFTAKKISYERRFGDYDWQDEYTTYPGECSGWQTIVLPFTPTKIEHETKGEIAPFNSGIEGAKPFWLRELTAEGFVDRTIMEPNKPYIIAMPNHGSYMDEYRLYGKIIFSAENVTLESTIDETTNEEKVYPASVGPEYDLQPTYSYVKHGPLIYALNVTYRINNHHYGSLFARSSSDVYAFEAYVKPGGRLARSAFGIDTSSSNTRSAKKKNTTGIPQIGDM